MATFTPAPVTSQMSPLQQQIQAQRTILSDVIQSGQSLLKSPQLAIPTQAQLREGGLGTLAARQQIPLRRAPVEKAIGEAREQEFQFETQVAQMAPEEAKAEYKEKAYAQAKTSIQPRVESLMTQIQERQAEIERIMSKADRSSRDEERIDSYQSRIRELNAELGVLQGGLQSDPNTFIKQYFSGELKARADYARQAEEYSTQRSEARREFKARTGMTIEEAKKIESDIAYRKQLGTWAERTGFEKLPTWAKEKIAEAPQLYTAPVAARALAYQFPELKAGEVMDIARVQMPKLFPTPVGAKPQLEITKLPTGEITFTRPAVLRPLTEAEKMVAAVDYGAKATLFELPERLTVKPTQFPQKITVSPTPAETYKALTGLDIFKQEPVITGTIGVPKEFKGTTVTKEGIIEISRDVAPEPTIEKYRPPVSWGMFPQRTQYELERAAERYLEPATRGREWAQIPFGLIYTPVSITLGGAGLLWEAGRRAIFEPRKLGDLPKETILGFKELPKIYQTRAEIMPGFVAGEALGWALPGTKYYGKGTPGITIPTKVPKIEFFGKTIVPAWETGLKKPFVVIPAEEGLGFIPERPIGRIYQAGRKFVQEKLGLEKLSQFSPSKILQEEAVKINRQRVTFLLKDAEGKQYILNMKGESPGGKIEKLGKYASMSDANFQKWLIKNYDKPAGQKLLMENLLKEFGEELRLGAADVKNLAFKDRIVFPEETHYVFKGQLKKGAIEKSKPGSDFVSGLKTVHPDEVKGIRGQTAQYPVETYKGIRAYEAGLINYMETGARPQWLTVRTVQGDYLLGYKSVYDVPGELQKTYIETAAKALVKKEGELLWAHAGPSPPIEQILPFTVVESEILGTKLTVRAGARREPGAGLYLQPVGAFVEKARTRGIWETTKTIFKGGAEDIWLIKPKSEKLKIAQMIGERLTKERKQYGYIALSYAGFGKPSEALLGIRLGRWKPTVLTMKEPFGKAIQFTKKALRGREREAQAIIGTEIATAGRRQIEWIAGKRVRFQPAKIVTRDIVTGEITSVGPMLMAEEAGYYKYVEPKLFGPKIMEEKVKVTEAPALSIKMPEEEKREIRVAPKIFSIVPYEEKVEKEKFMEIVPPRYKTVEYAKQEIVSPKLELYKPLKEERKPIFELAKPYKEPVKVYKEPVRLEREKPRPYEYKRPEKPRPYIYYRKEPPPLIGKIEKPEVEKIRKKEEAIKAKKMPGFEIQVRRRKKYEKVPTPFAMPREEAIAKGIRLVRGEAAATFKLVPSPKPVRVTGIKPGPEAKLFYTGRKGEFIQRELFRILTPGEKKAITYKGLAVIRRERIKKAKVPKSRRKINFFK